MVADLTERLKTELAQQQITEPFIYMVEFSPDTTLSRSKRAALRIFNPLSLLPYYNPEDANAAIRKICSKYFVDSREFDVVPHSILTDMDHRYRPAPAANNHSI